MVVKMHLSEETYERYKIKILHFVNMLISGKTSEEVKK